MMDCKQVRRLISPYLDSELSRSETFEVCEHLRQCPDCAARFEQERVAEELIRERLLRTRMPEPLWDRIQRKLTRRGLAPWNRYAWTLATAAALLLVALGVGLWNLRTGPADLPPVIREYQSVAARTDPAAAAGGIDQLAQVLRSTFGDEVTIELDRHASRHGGLRLAGAETHYDSAGRKYVEARLVCCGQPVLLVLGELRDGPPEILRDLPLEKPDVEENFDGVRVHTRTGAHLAAAVVSRHPIWHIASGIRLASR